MRQIFRSPRARFSTGASTLVEAIIACAIVSLFFGSIYASGWRSLHSLKAAMEGATASQQLMNLSEQIRTSSWSTITDPTELSSFVYTNSSAKGHLSNLTQAIYVNAWSTSTGYPSGYSGSPPVGGQTIEVACDSNGNVTTPRTGNGQLSSQKAVRVDIVVSWTALFNSTPHTRMVSLVVSPGGVVGQH
jgi:hypothetical protein